MKGIRWRDLPSRYRRQVVSSFIRRWSLRGGILAIEAVTLVAIGWRMLRPSECSDVTTAIYYTLSTIAQTTAALAGFLFAVVTLRLSRIGELVERGLRIRESFPDQQILARGIADVFYVRPYTTEERTVLRRAIWALATSALTVAVSFLGLAATPWLNRLEQSWLLMAVLAFALVALDLQILTIASSLRSMGAELSKRSELVEETRPAPASSSSP